MRDRQVDRNRDRKREEEGKRERRERENLREKNRRKAGRSVGNSRGGSFGYTAETYLINQPTDQPFIDRCNPSHVAPIQTSRALPSARTSGRQLSLSRFSPLSYNANYFSPERSISASTSGPPRYADKSSGNH